MESGFGKLRAFLWPVHRHELKKIIPMLIIFFLIGFNYNILRAAKDALLVTAPDSGAEALPFIKVWVILPMAFLSTFLFTRLFNRFQKEKVFYIIIGFFIAFFALFAFILYPLKDQLHPHNLADRLQEMLPLGCRGLVAIFRNWTFTAFYIMAELWSTLIMTVLFWGFVNEVTSVNDAKRFYGLLGISANGSGIFAGQVATLLSAHTFNPSLPFGTDAWGQSVVFLNGIIIVAGLICIVLFRYLHKKGLGYPSESKIEHTATRKKVKMGLRQSFRYLSNSKYLISIALIVVMYNIAINLAEVLWKDQVKQLYPDPSAFNAYMGQVLTAIGVVATLTAIFISGNVIRRFSWTFSAMIPCMIMLATTVGFFAFMIFKESPSALFLAAFVGTTPLAISVFFGSMQNCLSRAAKYTLFDATKELAFVPLDPESKLKGKAAIDGVGSRLGKSGGSVIHQGLLMTCGTLTLSTPYVGFILLLAIGSWMMAVRSLGKQFSNITSEQPA